MFIYIFPRLLNTLGLEVFGTSKPTQKTKPEQVFILFISAHLTRRDVLVYLVVSASGWFFVASFQRQTTILYILYSRIDAEVQDKNPS